MFNRARSAALAHVDRMYRLDSRLLEGVTLGTVVTATLVAGYAELSDDAPEETDQPE